MLIKLINYVIYVNYAFIILHTIKDVMVIFRETFHPSICPVIHPQHEGDNHVAIDLIVQHIHTKLGHHDLRKIYPNVYVIQSTF
jgi:hypothetical protein